MRNELSRLAHQPLTREPTLFGLPPRVVVAAAVCGLLVLLGAL
jgi:hypothetical protein